VGVIMQITQTTMKDYNLGYSSLQNTQNVEQKTIEQKKFDVVNEETRKELLEALNLDTNFIKSDSLDIELNYRIDKVTKDITITVVDSKTQEVITQVPGEAVANIRKRMNEILGAIINEKL
jgi:uncharacterized FlaG/YvyC family protein